MSQKVSEQITSASHSKQKSPCTIATRVWLELDRQLHSPGKANLARVNFVVRLGPTSGRNACRFERRFPSVCLGRRRHLTFYRCRSHSPSVSRSRSRSQLN